MKAQAGEFWNLKVPAELEEKVTCSLHPEHQRAGKRTTELGVVLDRPETFDIMWTRSNVCLIQQHVLDAFKEQAFSGIQFNPVAARLRVVPTTSFGKFGTTKAVTVAVRADSSFSAEYFRLGIFWLVLVVAHQYRTKRRAAELEGNALRDWSRSYWTGAQSELVLACEFFHAPIAIVRNLLCALSQWGQTP